jgi:flagellar hook-associated protein 1 FlgK
MLLEARLAQQLSAQSSQSALSQGLSSVDAAMGTPGASLDAGLTAFFDAFSQLAADPTTAAARQTVLSQADSLTSQFHDLSARLTAARDDANAGIKNAVDQVNALAGQIASLNASIASAGTRGSTQLLQYRDDQIKAVDQLSALLQVHMIQREDGQIDVTFGSGRALVAGSTAVPLETAPAADGTLTLRSQGADVTSEAAGGQIGGLRQLRDVLIPGYQNRLDTLARTVVDQVNALHTSGFDLDGQGGLFFFTPITEAAGAAAAIAVNPAVEADPRRVAAASVVSAGDNQVARAIAALRDAKLADGGTATLAEGFGTLSAQVGRDTATARQQEQDASDAVLQVRNLQQSVSGVSIDEEAATMMKFQRAYEANARYFQAINAALDILMQVVGG